MQHLRTLCTVAALLACSWCTASLAHAQVKVEHFESDIATPIKPWTSLDFYNDPMNFQFAIVSDRTGGLRPGVFADAVKKLNLLMPEFVMSVGDFIPGNTSDRAQLEKEWADFDAVLKPLKVPFFFIPGNHDINNDVMRDVWKERSGVPFYSFVYKDVLFLALDSTGDHGYIIPDEQVEYMQRTLAEHAAVRWTFVFLHHPLWLYENPDGFTKIEGLLEGRPHTVIAGHFHRYLHEWRNNANYYILATTGGGSQLRGPRYGEFDHVTWVTMSDAGPVMANLRLDGILPHDVTTKEDVALTTALTRGARLPYLLLTDGEDAVREGTLYLTLNNPSERAMTVKAKFMHAHEITLVPDTIDAVLAPGSQQTVEVAVESSQPESTESPALLQLDWTIGFEIDGEEDLFLSGTRNIPLRPTSMPLIQTVAPEFVGSLDVGAHDTPGEYTLRYTRDGSTPTADSEVFAAPLQVTGETTVRARMFNDKGHGTTTDTQAYRPVEAGAGLRYRMYRGTWTRMPDFAEMTPVFEGVATNLDVESRQFWADGWGMVLEGDWDVKEAGEYTFHVNSDDGSRLYIDDALVVDNDGDHSLLELNGKKQLSAGPHEMRIEFFEAGGEAVLQVDVEGPGMTRQPLPIEQLSH
ncbi:MAG: PA14 domain-containing protein [Pirellulales bacterium]